VGSVIERQYPKAGNGRPPVAMAEECGLIGALSVFVSPAR